MGALTSNLEALKAAVNHLADAVFFGLLMLSAVIAFKGFR